MIILEYIRTVTGRRLEATADPRDRRANRILRMLGFRRRKTNFYRKEI